jgi:hypothetical protein
MEYIFFSIVAALSIGGIIWCYREEKREYNDGICPKCGTPLENFDVDSQGGRGYVCTKCHYVCWVSYNIDKHPVRYR